MVLHKAERSLILDLPRPVCNQFLEQEAHFGRKSRERDGVEMFRECILLGVIRVLFLGFRGLSMKFEMTYQKPNIGRSERKAKKRTIV
jgi:hypothetical protein